ncbi:hypothetical protein SteCoe_29637 [Stentor coeruleus]|uniref:Sulfite exporter TauE/SafE n=1 Tax=Stentor coeruleus TaxID=5963 RepID=A0A1R2B5F9_9CILI|nr:hypothetical protein SteCoe_29637 [Stentor coeruleus]
MIIFNLEELFGSFILFLLSIVGRTAGLGGSVFAIGIFLLLFKFNLYYSIGYTQVLIFTGTLTTMLLRFKTRSPLGDKPMIEFDILMQVITPVLLGLSFGSHVIPAFPVWLISVIFVTFNGILCIFVLLKIILYYKNPAGILSQCTAKNNEENSDHIASTDRLPQSIESEQAIFGHNLEENSENIENFVNNNDHSESNDAKNSENENNYINEPEKYQDNYAQNEEVIEIGKKDIEKNEIKVKFEYFLAQNKRVMTNIQLVYYVLVFIISVFLSNIFLSPSVVGVSPCSDKYAYLIAIYAILILIINTYTSFYLVNKTKIYQASSYNFQPYDIIWTYRLCLKVLTFSLIFGYFLGVLGMSTGYIISPFLLYFNLPPAVTTFSSSFAICYTSSIPTLQFIISNDLDYRYCIWITLVSILGSLGGSLGLRPWILQRKKNYLLLIVLIFIMIISLGILFAVQIFKLANNSFVLNFALLCDNN